MLVLTRKTRDTIRIGNNVTVTILRVKGNTVRVGIEAPRQVRVVRGELPDDFKEESSAEQEEAGPVHASDSRQPLSTWRQRARTESTSSLPQEADSAGTVLTPAMMASYCA